MPTKTTKLSSPMHSFDAQVWAKSFIEHVKSHPEIPTDEATMVSWFASALMRGHDEAMSKKAKGKI